MQRTDDILMNDFRNGDRSAFELLVTRYKLDIFQFILSKVYDRELASDLTQDVFVKLYQSVENYTAAGKFKAWIFRIAHNLCIDEFRKQQKASILSIQTGTISENSESFPYENQLSDPSATPVHEFEHLELQHILENALQAIPEKHRSALVLCQYHGLSYQEIAEIQKCPVGTVKSRVHNALMKMKDILKNKEIF